MTRAEALDPTLFQNLILDTQVIDCLVDNPKIFELFLVLKSKMKFRVTFTYVQHSELVNTASLSGKIERYLTLSKAVLAVNPDLFPSEAFILDYSVLDTDKLPSDATLLTFDAFLGGSKEGNHVRDAAIAVTALNHSALLITNDGGMIKKSKRAKIKHLSWSEFQDQLIKLAF
jgi:hypothetical protein